MSAFNDFCLVCEKVCDSNQVYCSDSCRQIDQEQGSFTSPTLSCSSNNTSVSHQHNHQIPDIISPLLTPQFNQSQQHLIPHSNKNYHYSTPGVFLKSPQFKDLLSYESPILMTTNYSQSNSFYDLDTNRLDLNVASCGSNSMNRLRSDSLKNSTNVSDALTDCASENYKRWLSHN